MMMVDSDERCMNCDAELQLFYVNKEMGLKMCPRCRWPFGFQELEFVDMRNVPGHVPCTHPDVVTICDAVELAFDNVPLRDIAGMTSQREAQQAEADFESDTDEAGGMPNLTSPWVNFLKVLNRAVIAENVNDRDEYHGGISGEEAEGQESDSDSDSDYAPQR